MPRFLLLISIVLSSFNSRVILADPNSQWHEHVVVIAEHMDSPTFLITDPKQPRQPIPAFDASGFLRSIPGFAVARKGSSGGDISLRGLSGSRINIVNDGQQVLGTCGGRMDPPTNYISPKNYDVAEIIKGPQTVKYGPVGSSGTVLFLREHVRMGEPGVEGRVGITTGTFGRLDSNLAAKMGNMDGYWNISTITSKSDDYKDGNGLVMQSKYDRYSFDTALGWTPDFDQLLELNVGTSDGHAEYSDRENIARKIANQNVSILYKNEQLNAYFNNLDMQLYYNKNDHIMDQFNKPYNPIKPHTGTNPQRTNYGGHFWLDYTPFYTWRLVLGVDALDTTEETRSATSLDELLDKQSKDVFSQAYIGAFIESEYTIRGAHLLSGIRYDYWISKLDGPWSTIDKTNKKKEPLVSGYTRIEYASYDQEYYAGLGYAQRIPDYWEVLKSGKTLLLEPEKTLQLDMGWIYKGPADVSLSLYYGEISDYILIDTQTKPMARNIDATVWGGELGFIYQPSPSWRFISTLAYSHGDNETDHLPLGQISPLETRFAINYQIDNWNLGAFWRLVGSQDRIATGQGNIVGQDMEKSSGFSVLSLNGRVIVIKTLSISFGLDNIFDVAYAEHISKSGLGNNALPVDYRTRQVNEPGRNIWLTVDYVF